MDLFNSAIFFRMNVIVDIYLDHSFNVSGGFKYEMTYCFFF